MYSVMNMYKDTWEIHGYEIKRQVGIAAKTWKFMHIFQELCEDPSCVSQRRPPCFSAWPFHIRWALNWGGSAKAIVSLPRWACSQGGLMAIKYFFFRSESGWVWIKKLAVLFLVGIYHKCTHLFKTLYLSNSCITLGKTCPSVSVLSVFEPRSESLILTRESGWTWQ